MAVEGEVGNANEDNLRKREAWRNYPDATSAESAIIGNKLVTEAKRNWDNNALSRIFASKAGMDQIRVEVARQAWEKLSPEEQKQVPNSARIFLATRLPDTPDGNNLHAKVLGGDAYADSGYTAWEQKNQIKMLREMGQDPIIAEGQRRWNDPDYSTEDKLRLAQRIQDIQARSFGAQPVPIVAVSKPAKDGVITNGENFSASKDGPARIELNTAEGSTMHRTFYDFVGTVSHEGTHALQDQIGERYTAIKGMETRVLTDLGVKSTSELSKEGLEIFNSERERRLTEQFPSDSNTWNKELGPGGHLFGVAPLFYYNSHQGYMNPDSAGQDNYKANPIEEHARGFGLSTARFLAGDAAAREEQLSSYKLYSEIHEESLDRTNKAREQVIKAAP